MMRTLGEERFVDVTILDCFWYHMYLNGSPKVMEWIKEKGIFSKTCTLVPIVDGGHWNLLILCNLGKSFNNNYSLCMNLLDSLIISEPMKAEPTIRRFVKDLYHTQGKLASSRTISSIPLLLPKISKIFKILLIVILGSRMHFNGTIKKGWRGVWCLHTLLHISLSKKCSSHFFFYVISIF
ncbi:hypothetical protein Taro_056470 [Colocasia esculenta]|uniref:Ubiquitin-like protease family profile domain-containing protein n=1 Tax=Colocasia esculenta TaxID=4460 RepID=A0A843XXF8_COLES|nr:hypothetical protein [Colocasia esculenta]